MVKKLLVKIYGNPGEFSMEHRILNVILAFCVFICFFFLVFSVIQSLGLFFYALITGIMLFYLGLYYLARMKRYYHIPLWFMILFLMFLLGFFYFHRGGYQKGVLNLGIIIVLIITLLLRNTSRIILLSILVLEIAILLVIEYLYPHLIYRDARVLSIFTIGASFFMVISSTSFLIVVFSKNYDYEKKCVEETNEKLNQLNNIKNDFIANITHDFRSPLTVIMNLTELEMENKTGEEREALNAIYVSSLMLKDLIDKLLELAKMDVQGVKLSIQRLNLTDFLLKIFNFYTSTLQGSNIELKVNFSKIPVDNLFTDAGKLEAILNNIISNSIKFVDPDNGKIDMETHVHESSVIIKITDNGIGIPGDKLEVIFNRFQQAHDSQNQYRRGTGIGLAFARELSGFLKARIWAESDGPHKGSSFFVELPRGDTLFKDQDIQDYSPFLSSQANYERDILKTLVQNEILMKKTGKKIIPMIKELNKEDEYNISKALILVIDDDMMFLDIIISYLQDAGFINFITASDGKCGKDAIYEYIPDLIISDFTMPGMSGGKLHEEIAVNPGFKDIPFIFVSAIANESIIFETKKRGAIAYLSKPIDKRELLLTVEIHLKRHFNYLKQIKQSYIDPLTGLKNRKITMTHLERELLSRTLPDLSIIFFDIDHFKNINDKYGHQRGDMVLEVIGVILQSKLRHYDIAGRYGGDEFLIILPNTPLESAKIAAENLQKEIKSAVLFWNKQEIRFSCSLGIASIKSNEKELCKALGISSFDEIYNIQKPHDADWQKIDAKKKSLISLLFDIADNLLYQAKQTCCRECGFISLDSSVFTGDSCPECNTKNIIKGRNRYIAK
ncbi:MAG: diguanylate cyclase [Spirochaetales bacterium]|nr:diguanylate cyclase [Spirochaetales bacterium]